MSHFIKIYYSILFYPITLEDRRGTTDNFATIPFHLVLKLEVGRTSQEPPCLEMQLFSFQVLEALMHKINMVTLLMNSTCSLKC